MRVPVCPVSHPHRDPWGHTGPKPSVFWVTVACKRWASWFEHQALPLACQQPYSPFFSHASSHQLVHTSMHHVQLCCTPTLCWAQQRGQAATACRPRAHQQKEQWAQNTCHKRPGGYLNVVLQPKASPREFCWSDDHIFLMSSLCPAHSRNLEPAEPMGQHSPLRTLTGTSLPCPQRQEYRCQLMQDNKSLPSAHNTPHRQAAEVLTE